MQLCKSDSDCENHCVEDNDIRRRLLDEVACTNCAGVFKSKTSPFCKVVCSRRRLTFNYTEKRRLLDEVACTNCAGVFKSKTSPYCKVVCSRRLTYKNTEKRRLIDAAQCQACLIEKKDPFKCPICA